MKKLTFASTIIIMLSLLLAHPSHAQENGSDSARRAAAEVNSPSLLTTFFQRLELRQSFGSAGLRNSPVRFQLTVPKDEAASYLIDGGIGLPVINAKLGKAWNLDGKIVTEYHRNTLIDDEQHNWQAGFSGTVRTKIRRSADNTRYSQLYFTPTIKYSRNLTDTANAVLFTMDVIPFRSGARGLNLNTYTIRGNRRFIHMLSLNPGFEFQNNFSAKRETNNGTILRPLLKFQYLLAGNRKRVPAEQMISPEKTWEASVDYTSRYAVINSTMTGERFTQLLRTGVDYYFLTNPVSISFGFSFNYGSDPLQGLRKQHFYLATLSLQK